MRARPAMVVLVVIGATAAWTFGCQLLYQKNELTVSTGGTTSSSGSAGSGGGGTGGGGTSTGTTTMGGGGMAGASTSSSGGAGGSTMSMGGGGSTMSSGGGGSGGMMSTSTTTTTSTSTGTMCTGDRLFLLGTSASNVLCATFTTMGGWVKSTSPSASSNERPAVGLIDAQKGVGTFFEGTAPGALRQIDLANGVCGAPADVLTIKTKAAPSGTVLAGKVQVLFQGAVGAGTDHPFLTAWDAANDWSAPAQIDVNVFSPQIAGLAASGTDMLAVYGGGDDNLYRVRHSGGAWQLPAACFKDAVMNCEQTNKAIQPAVAGLPGGGWLVVFQDKASGTTLRWLTQDAVTTASVPIAGASSSSPVSLASTPGGAVLAFRNAATGAVSAAEFDGKAWGAVQTLPGNPTTPASPSIAAGVCTHAAELVYIDAADGSVKHASLEAGVWSAPVLVGGASMKGVAIASFQ